MKKLFIWLLQNVLEGKSCRALVAWQRHYLQSLEEIHYTPEDGAALHTFFTTPAGEKLTAYLQHREAQNNSSAILHAARDDARYSCGFAAGYRAAVAELFSLTAPAAPDAADLDELTKLAQEEGLEHLIPN